MTYSPAPAQQLFPARTWRGEVAVVFAGATLVALLAQAAVPLWPVPVTGQTLGVLLVGAWLGFRRGVAAIGLYLLAGFAGAPVFAAGAAGLDKLAGPTGGYLVGFLLSAGTAGLLAEHGFLHGPLRALATMAVATIPVYVLGLAWLHFYVPADEVLAVGLWPFLPGAVVKIGLAGLLTARSGRRASRSPRTRGS